MLFYLDNPQFVILATLAFFVAVAVHEASHAFVAMALGDDTPRKHGRLSLNPMRHVDRMGILMFAIAMIGWGSTPVTPANLKPNPRHGEAIVAIAGPAANLLMAFLFYVPIRMGLVTSGIAAQFLAIASGLNVLLFVFNLLPVPPLDGFTVLRGILPRQLAWKLHGLEQYGMGLLMLLMFLPFILSSLGLSIPGCGTSFIGCLTRPVSRLLGVPGLV